MSDAIPQTSQPSAGRRFLRVLWTIVKVLLVLAIVAGLAAAVYFGVPYLYRTYFLPIQTDVAELSGARAEFEQDLDQIMQRLDDMQSRLNQLELQQDTQREASAENAAALERLATTQAALLDSQQALLSTSEARFAGLAATQEAEQEARLALESQGEDRAEDLEAVRADLEELSQRFEDEQAPVAVLRRELAVVRAMEMLTRSRLLLVQNNLGLAQEDLQSARDLLADLRTRVPAHQIEYLDRVASRLDLALGNLPDAPVLAAEDVEIAWQLLRSGLPGEPTLEVISTAAAETELSEAETEEGGTPAPAGTATPTPVVTPTPTSES